MCDINHNFSRPRVEIRFRPVDIGFQAASEVGHETGPANPISVARSRFDAALHAERENVTAALDKAAVQAAQDATRIRDLETALATVHRLTPNDAGIRQIVVNALKGGK